MLPLDGGGTALCRIARRRFSCYLDAPAHENVLPEANHSLEQSPEKVPGITGFVRIPDLIVRDASLSGSFLKYRLYARSTASD